MQDKNIILTIVGNNIRKFRKEKGISQEEFALDTNFDRSYIGRIERGERNISVLTLYKLAKSLNIEPASLFYDDENKL